MAVPLAGLSAAKGSVAEAPVAAFVFSRAEAAEVRVPWASLTGDL
jgi:hypothetical protein